MSERKRVFILEFSPVVASDGSTQTFLFSTQGFSTGAADTPSNTKVKPFLSNPGSLKRDLFSEARVTGAIKPNYGNIVLRNPVQTKGGSGELDAWVDYGLAGTRIKCYWGVPGDAYPGSWKLVYIAYCHSFLADVNELVFRLRDQLQLLDNPVAAEGFLGSGGLEGNGGISKPKQWVSGDPGFITPILVDYAKQIYLVQVNGCFNPDFYLTNATPINSFDVFEGGVEIDRAQPNYTSAADILANSPTAGTVRYFFGPANPLMAGWFDGPVYFRLGSPPANDLRVYAQGVPTSKDMLAWGSAFGSYTADLLAVRAGVPRTSISSGSAFLPVSYVLVDDATSYLSVLSDAALAYQGFFGFTRLDTFKSGYLCSPEDNGFYYGVTSSSGLSVWPPAAAPTTSLRTFNTDQVKDFKREPVSGMEVPIWSVQVSAGKTQASKILAGASNEMKDYLSRDPYWVTVTGYSASTILANPGAAAAVVEIPGRVLQNSFATRMWLERYFVLYGGRRHFYTFSVPMTDSLLNLELHDVVTLQGPRYGLSAGKKFRVVGITLDCSAAVPMMAFTCWGGDIGQYTGGGVPGVIWGGGSGGGGTNTAANIAQQSLGLFTGQMVGSVGVGSAESPSCNPHYTQVALQANFEGADAATTSSDLSSHARTLTGTALYAALSTTRSKFGGSSLKIANKTSNGVAIARHADFAYTTSTPWTFGLWFYVDTWGAPALFPLVEVYDSVGGQAWWVGVYGTSGSLHLSWNFGAGGTPTGSHVVSQGGWHYLEIVNDGSYSGNFIKGFLDGALDFTVAGSGAGTFAVYLGGYHSYGAASSADGYVMYIDEAMFTVGSALHSADFTPATQATPALQCGVGVVPGDGGTSLVATGMTSLGAFTGQLVGLVTNPPGFSWTSHGSALSWHGIASSSTGAKLVAVANGGQIYTSTDSGANWTARDSNRAWYSVASSSDGTKLVAVVFGGQIYTSTDSGANWTARDSNRGWIGVASSGDGAKLVAVVSGGQIYTSTDSGANWTARNSNRSWACVASSDDGVNLVAAVNASSSIYTSTDSGVNWSLNTVSGTHYWTSLASSSNGVKLLATADSDQLYTSTDSGANWTARDSSRSWWGGSSSADGTILLACASGGKLYVSLDSGVNWTARDSNRSWFASAVASDASKMAAVEVGGLIYTSP